MVYFLYSEEGLVGEYNQLGWLQQEYTFDFPASTATLKQV